MGGEKSVFLCRVCTELNCRKFENTKTQIKFTVFVKCAEAAALSADLRQPVAVASAECLQSVHDLR